MEKYEIFISPLAEKAINDLLDYLINHWSEKAEKAFLKNSMKNLIK